MSSAEIIAHWRKGSLDSVDIARLVLEAGKYDHALFQCQLAVEKTLKVLHMLEHESDAPFTHNLEDLADLLSKDFSDDEKTLLQELTDFAVDARYNDPEWAEREATKEKAEQYVSAVSVFVHTHLS